MARKLLHSRSNLFKIESQVTFVPPGTEVHLLYKKLAFYSNSSLPQTRMKRASLCCEQQQIENHCLYTVCLPAICKTFEPSIGLIRNREVCHVTYHIIQGVPFIAARNTAVVQPTGHSMPVCDAHESDKRKSQCFHLTVLQGFRICTTLWFRNTTAQRWRNK